MYVKVKTDGSGESWKLFGGFNAISFSVHHYVGRGVASGGVVKDSLENNLILREDVQDFTQRPCTEDEARKGVVEIWGYGKTPSETCQILSFTPVFIMNDDGKTIERV